MLLVDANVIGEVRKGQNADWKAPGSDRSTGAGPKAKGPQASKH
jgi:hypothetical protein